MGGRRSERAEGRALGKVTLVRDYPTFLVAGQRLLDDVAAQRIVWLDGVHLPQSITLSPKASGIRIAE